MGIGAACNVLGYLALWAAASGCGAAPQPPQYRTCISCASCLAWGCENCMFAACSIEQLANIMFEAAKGSFSVLRLKADESASQQSKSVCIMLTGVCLGTCGRRIDLAYWQVIAFAVLACNSGAWIDVACLATSTRNFPGERGTVIGILKSTLGAHARIAGLPRNPSGVHTCVVSIVCQI